nr:hypothetical protein [Nonomuraea antri]
MRQAIDTALLSVIGFVNQAVFVVSRGRVVLHRFHGIPEALLTTTGPAVTIEEPLIVGYLPDGGDYIVLDTEAETTISTALRTATAATLFDQQIPVDITLLTDPTERAALLNRILKQASIYERHEVTRHHQVPIARLTPHQQTHTLWFGHVRQASGKRSTLRNHSSRLPGQSDCRLKLDKDHRAVLDLRIGGSDPVRAGLEVYVESVVGLEFSTGNGGVEEHHRLPYLPVHIFVRVPIRPRRENSLGCRDQLGFGVCADPEQEGTFGREISRHGRFAAENESLLRADGDGADIAFHGAGTAVIAPSLDGTIVVVHACPGVELGLGDRDQRSSCGADPGTQH